MSGGIAHHHDGVVSGSTGIADITKM